MYKCTKLAMHLMKKHGLLDKGWKFGYDKAKTRCGICDYSNKIIKLSRYYVRDPSVHPKNIEDTILHEIAHAIVGYDAAHNAQWKRVAIYIGCSGEVCNSGWKGATPNYRLWCNCKKIDVSRYRIRSKYRSGVCGSCRTLHITRI